MATFEQRFAASLERARPGIIARTSQALRAALTSEELSSLEQFVLGEETSPLFMRLMQQWINRGGGDAPIDVSTYTRSELSTLAAFMQGPGGSVFNAKGAAFEAILIAELSTFVPSFEREFFSGLCTATGEECPAWVGRQER